MCTVYRNGAIFQPPGQCLAKPAAICDAGKEIQISVSSETVNILSEGDQLPGSLSQQWQFGWELKII
jgi:hypothetical protein